MGTCKIHNAELIGCCPICKKKEIAQAKLDGEEQFMKRFEKKISLYGKYDGHGIRLPSKYYEELKAAGGEDVTKES